MPGAFIQSPLRPASLLRRLAYLYRVLADPMERNHPSILVQEKMFGRSGRWKLAIIPHLVRPVLLPWWWECDKTQQPLWYPFVGNTPNVKCHRLAGPTAPPAGRGEVAATFLSGQRQRRPLRQCVAWSLRNDHTWGHMTTRIS